MHSYERSVAVIGSGVAGLVAAYALSARDRVTLFEADTRIGGHAHTHYIDRGDGSIVGVDTAFLVHNDRTYPTLCRLFAELGIATKETDMSMSVRDDGSGLEYAGARGIGGLFPSWSSLGRPRYLLMLAEVKRFHAAATRLLQTDADGATLGAFLDRHGFSSYFVDHFMTPLVAAVWSCPPGEAMRYPARMHALRAMALATLLLSPLAYAADAWTPEAGQIFAELGLTPGGARRQLLESVSFRALLERGGADLPLAA